MILVAKVCNNPSYKSTYYLMILIAKVCNNPVKCMVIIIAVELNCLQIRLKFAFKTIIKFPREWEYKATLRCWLRFDMTCELLCFIWVLTSLQCNLSTYMLLLGVDWTSTVYDLSTFMLLLGVDYASIWLINYYALVRCWLRFYMTYQLLCSY